MRAPVSAVGDGALGLFNALGQVWPQALQQRCWVHKIARVLLALPKRLHARAKQLLHDISHAQSRTKALAAAKVLADVLAEHPKAVGKVTGELDVLLELLRLPRGALQAPAHDQPDIDVLHGGDHCHSEIRIERNVTVTVEDGPARIFVPPGAGTLVHVEGSGEGNRSLINVTSDRLLEPVQPPLPDSTHLQIYVSGADVDFSNNSRRIAASYAPRSFGDFAARGTMFGAAICERTEAVGSFRFWYDVRASDIQGAPWTASGWSEQFPNTSGFSWATS